MKVTVSIGVSSLHLRNLSMEELVDEADRALRSEKQGAQSGQNRSGGHVMHRFIDKFRGFTLAKILVVLFLVGLVALPFTNMFLFGVQGSHDNAEHVLAYNLAREKLEEIKGLPFEIIKSDYENFREAFQDRQKYDEAYYNEASFEKYFSDVFTDRSLNDSELKRLSRG